LRTTPEHARALEGFKVARNGVPSVVREKRSSEPITQQLLAFRHPLAAASATVINPSFYHALFLSLFIPR
jgi:hypothetical protein